MGIGQQRKQLIKLARKVPIEQVRGFLESRDGEPQHFVLCEHGIELIRHWHPIHKTMEVRIDDDVFAEACVAYLKDKGLVFDSEEEALAYKQTLTPLRG